MSRRLLGTCVLCGVLIRAAGLALPGTLDVMVWKIWSYNAARIGPTSLYGVGGNPPERRLLKYAGQATTVDYPPLALFELAVVGQIVHGLRPSYPNDAILTAALKLAPVAAEVGLTILLFRFVKRFAPRNEGVERAAALTALAYWLNPAAILDASFLGYLDPLFVLPAVLALFAACAGWIEVAGALFAAAVLTKAQAVLVLPVFGLLLAVSPERLGRFVAGMFYVAALLIVPYVVVGAWPNMLNALASLARHDMLSGFAANLWWVVTYVARALYAVKSLGAWTAFTMPVRILAISTLVELGNPNPRLVAAAMVLAAWSWGLWRARKVSDPFLLAGVGAFLVHAYFVLAVQVHENHLYTAVPLLALAAAGRPSFRPMFACVSAIVALNLNLFYGVSEEVGYGIPRGITVIDASVVLAIANTIALGWHARILSRECALGPAAPLAWSVSPGSPKLQSL
ncbi:MAG: hypothetical protein HYZ58_11210 [Acidobacteria bacterium]|nr:hypothetical protein [Acidobacteriota bacterium]